MPITSEEKKVHEEGAEKDAIVIQFTNGAKDQLVALQEYFQLNTSVDLIQLAISLLQSFREKEEKGKSDGNA